MGTARLVELGLQRAQLTVARSDGLWGLSSRLEVPPNTGLLYPSEHAHDLESAAPPPSHLIVLDGTWHHARRLYLENPWLQGLPHYRLQPKRPSNYRLRREPRADYISTVEAIVAALEVLEPECTGLDALLRAFDSMIDDQLEFVRGPAVPRQRKTRPRAWRALPRALVEDLERLVVIYGESRGARPGQKRGRELLMWVAERPLTGERFVACVRPEQLPSPKYLQHLGLQAAMLERGLTLEQLREQWQSFSKPGDVQAAWNQSTLDLRDESISSGKIPDSGSLLLKAVYCNIQRGRHAGGPLEDILQAEGVAAAPTSLPGRAGRRLASAVAMARLLSSMATRPRKQLTGPPAPSING